MYAPFVHFALDGGTSSSADGLANGFGSSRHETVRRCYRSFMFRSQEPKDFKDWKDLLGARRGPSPVSCSQPEARPAQG